MRVSRLSDALGAEITGIDLNKVDAGLVDEIRSAFLEHQLLCFREQELAPSAQIAFSSFFGKIESRPGRPFTFPGLPELSILSNKLENGKPVGVINAGDFWHSDLSFGDIPCRTTFLHALEVASEGGDTEWSNMYAALEALPTEIRDMVKDLNGIHVFDRRRNPRAQVDTQFREAADKVYGIPIPDAIHPIVRTHPDTRRDALYVSPRFVVGIEGMDHQSSEDLLEYLFEHQIKTEFRYRHKWRQGDLLMWDNPCLIHIGRGQIRAPGIRHMHRTMVLGERPFRDTNG